MIYVVQLAQFTHPSTVYPMNNDDDGNGDKDLATTFVRGASDTVSIPAIATTATIASIIITRRHHGNQE